MARSIRTRTTAPSSYDPGRSPFVAIAGTVGGTLIVMLAVIGIFAHDSAAVAMPIVAGSMAVMGIFLGLFALKRS